MTTENINKNKLTGDMIVAKLRDYSQDPFVKKKVEKARKTLVKSGLLSQNRSGKSNK